MEINNSRLSKIIFYLVITSINSISIGKICGRVTYKYPKPTFFIQDKLISLSYSENSTVMQIKDINNILIKEIKIPKVISNIYDYENKVENGFIYSTKDGRFYQYDFSGNEFEIPLPKKSPNNSFYCNFSEGLNRLLFCVFTEGKRLVYDYKTRSYIEIPDTQYSSIGDTVAYAEASNEHDSFDKIAIYDFQTKNMEKFDVPKSQYIYLETDNHLKVIIDGSELTTNYYKMEGHWVKFQDTQLRRLSFTLKNGFTAYLNAAPKSKSSGDFSYSNLNNFNVTTEIYDTKNKKIKSIEGAYFSIYNSKLFAKVDSASSWRFWTEDQFEQLIGGNTDIKPVFILDNLSVGFSFSRNGKWAMIPDSSNNGTLLINTINGKKIKIPFEHAYSEIIESEDNRTLFIKHNYSKVLLVDTKSGVIKKYNSILLRHDPNFEKLAVASNTGLGELSEKREMCLPETVQLVDNEKNNIYYNGVNYNKQPISLNDSLENLKINNLSNLCEDNKFDNEKWDQLTPPLKKGEFSRTTGFFYLKRFQKENGYNPALHLPVLSAIVRSKLTEEEPFLFIEALKGISVKYPEHVRMMYNLVGIDSRLVDSIPEDPSKICQSTSDKNSIKSKFETIFSLASNIEIPINTDNLIEFKPFKGDFLKLNEEQRTAIIAGLAEKMTNAALLSDELKGVFQSKLKIFSKKFVRRLLGLKANIATDMAVGMKNGNYVPIALSSENIEGGYLTNYEDTESPSKIFGFDFKLFNKLSLPKVSDPVGTEKKINLSWQHNDKQYTGEIIAKVLEPLGNLIPPEKSPDYKQIFIDKKLTGMMIIGSNLSAEREDIVDEYVTYFENDDYEFDDPVSVNTLDFFSEKVKSGELDYLVKEAHSDGDEKNLLMLNTFGKLMTGRLKKKNGFEEVIYLLYPDSEKFNTVRLSNHDFGDWIRARPKDAYFYYINASCSSERKVISEIAAVRSPNFIPFPSISTVMTFLDDEENGTRAILNSLRDQLSYEDMRNRLKATNHFKKNLDHFLFPDEPEYDKIIRKNLVRNLDIVVTTRDSEGKEVFLDQATDH